MSDLVVVGFEHEGSADQVLNKLDALSKEHLVDMADACVVMRNIDGKVRVRQALGPFGAGPAGGVRWVLWALLLGPFYLNPLLSLVREIVIDARPGLRPPRFCDGVIDDAFIRSLGSPIQPGHSALFMLVGQGNLDKVLPELQPFAGTLRTALSSEQEARLRVVLNDLAPPPATTATI